MDDPFFSTVDTFTCSLHEHSSVSVHDLLDAYAMFTIRVTSQTYDTSFLKTHKDNLVHTLRRDVRRALSDPPSLAFGGGISRQFAMDALPLCHHALCALTTILRSPAFYSVLSEDDLSSLFGDVLEISRSDSLPGPDQPKTLSLALGALNCHLLPLAVLSPRGDDIFFVLQRSLDNTNQPTNIVLEGLKAISHTIQRHPSAFLLPLSPLLPHVIANAFCSSYELSLQASIALGKFASALISESELSLTKWQISSYHVVSFLESYCAQAACEDTGFSRTVRAAFSAELSPHPELAPTWILVVLASLIVLCGPTLYKQPTVLRLILQSLAMALTHERSVMRALYPHVWRCLVWTFSRMLLSPESKEPAAISSAFHVIKQEVNGGIGVALANVLLSDQIPLTRSHERGERVSQVLSVIKAMVQTEYKHTRLEGFMFLQAFLNDAQVRRQITQNVYETPATIFFNGAIVGAEWDNLPLVVHSIPKVSVTVYWPEEAEMARHFKTLLVIWKHFAIKAGEDGPVSSIVDVWLAILLVYSRQREAEQPVPTTEVLIFSAQTVVEFLPSGRLDESQSDWSSWSVHDQLCRLSFIDKLWSAMRQAFVSLSLEECAELILTSILKCRFHVLDVDVHVSWGTLCASLMVTTSPSFLRDIHNLVASHSVIKSQQELWGAVATSLSSSNPALGWSELVKFLAIPICSWALSKPELEAWEAILRKAVIVPRDSTITAEFLQYFRGKEVENWESIIPVLDSILTFISEHGIHPADELLVVLNASLTVSYSRAYHAPEGLGCSLKLLHIVRRVIVSDPTRVMHSLHALRGCLSLWIEDHTGVMSDDEFNSVVIPLYCETLNTLQALPLSIQSLQDMEDFLGSAFSRIPTPAIAPFAFEKFWRATYHGRGEFSNILPPKIKSCLVCFVAAYGGDLADGLSLTTESQSQSINDDSQTPFPINRLLRHSGESDVPDIPLRHTEDVAFLEDEAPRPTALRQLQEYSSRMDEAEPEGSLTVPTSARSAMPGTPSSENILPVPRYAHQKHKRAESGDYPLRDDRRKETRLMSPFPDARPRKRSRITRATLRAARKFESEPATRDVTPIRVLPMNSVPLKKRVFDGVQVPTLRAVRRSQEDEQEAETSRDAVSAEQGRTPAPQTPPSRAPGTTLSLAMPSLSGDARLDRDGTWSEIDVDQSLMPTSTPRGVSAGIVPSSRSPTHDGSDRIPGPSLAVPQSSPSAPPRPSLRRAKTTSAKLDALQDVYSAVANGASQIPMSELVQATRLVHQIGAVLTDQMGKKMADR